MPEPVKRLLVTGRNGQVGHCLAGLDWPGFKVHALDREDLDLADPGAVRRVVRELSPDVLVNAAAYTAVDAAEDESELAHAINAAAPAAMASELARSGGLLVHYSTDYVFAGDAERAYRESDPTAPTGVYGASKLAGEVSIRAAGCEHLVLRTSWVYADRGHNFLRTMLRLAAERDELKVVVDQRGTPTYALDLAVMTRDMVARAVAGRDPDHLGVFHLGNTGETTWYEFAVEIMRLAGHHVKLIPVTTDEFPTRARRPAYSVLDKARATAHFGLDIADWRDALGRCLSRMDALVAD